MFRRPSFLQLLNDDFMSPMSMTMLNNGALFNEDAMLNKFYKEKEDFLEEINDKINERKQTLLKEHEINNPASYTRKYSSSRIYNNGDERSEVKDVIEENKDGQKSISQKTDTYEKKDGQVIQDSHFDVKLNQDKVNKNIWTITNGGKTIQLDFLKTDVGEKLQSFLNENVSSTTETGSKSTPTPTPTPTPTQKRKSSVSKKKRHSKKQISKK